eukprot:4124725-Amphidinium_carterae.1
MQLIDVTGSEFKGYGTTPIAVQVFTSRFCSAYQHGDMIVLVHLEDRIFCGKVVVAREVLGSFLTFSLGVLPRFSQFQPIPTSLSRAFCASYPPACQRVSAHCWDAVMP